MTDLPGRDRRGVPAWRVDRIAGHAELVVDEVIWRRASEKVASTANWLFASRAEAGQRRRN